MGRRYWTEKEVELLESLLNFYSGVELVKRYRREAKALGLPERTVRSIRGKAWSDFGTIRPIYDNHTARSLAQLLKLPKATVVTWIHRNQLKATRRKKSFRITNKDFENFAMARPDIARRCDLDGLIFLLGKDKAIAIKNSKPPKNAPQPVLYLVNGKVYPSICEASRQTHWSERTIRDRLKKGIEWAKVS